MKITKVVITGYVGYDKETVEETSLDVITYHMDEGEGICEGIECEEIDIDSLPESIKQFFVENDE